MKLVFRLSALALFAAMGLVTGCDKPGGLPPMGGPGGPRPPAEVTVVTLATAKAALVTDLPARTTAFRIAEVRPQVNGIILKRLFTEGDSVEAGQQLYQIDPAPYQATAKSAEAALFSARALAQRYQPLVAAYAVSKQDYDNAVASEKEAEANVDTAHINLAYTKVLSPITGVTGRSSVTEGALVTSNQSNSLVTVQQLDPIYVDAVQPSVLLLRLEREMASGKLQKAGSNEAQVKLLLEDGTAYDQPGRLEFAETTVDQGTGSVVLRMVFPNPKHLLLPGMFVHAQVLEGNDAEGLLVPQQGVTHDANGQATALVVGEGDKVELRVIQASRAIGNQWLVTDGLKAGERVIVEGVQKAMPGAVVKPVEQAAAAQ